MYGAAHGPDPRSAADLQCDRPEASHFVRVQRRKRVGEPQCYGIGTRDKELLRVFLIEGITREREPLFSVTGIEELELLDQTFKRPGPNYKKNDSAMKRIFCEL